jgi:hypothetical protein
MSAQIIQFRRPVTTEEYFGGCPECGQTDGYLNLGRDHWFVCDQHRTKWWIGSNVFSCWRNETQEDWYRAAAKLSQHREVEPIYPTRNQDAAS